MRALLKLPFGETGLQSKRGRLAKASLERHRKQWRSAVAAYIDEVSMISGNQLLQFDVCMRQAKLRPAYRFGKLAVNLCGHILQLPPVDKHGSRKSLAVPLDHVGRMVEEVADAEEGDVNEVSTAKTEAKVEGRQGFELWRSITRVVCLTVNVQAPGVLIQLQAEKRDGHISD